MKGIRNCHELKEYQLQGEKSRLLGLRVATMAIKQRVGRADI